jgi:hypothetical protein
LIRVITSGKLYEHDVDDDDVSLAEKQPGDKEDIQADVVEKANDDILPAAFDNGPDGKPEVLQVMVQDPADPGFLKHRRRLLKSHESDVDLVPPESFDQPVVDLAVLQKKYLPAHFR